MTPYERSHFLFKFFILNVKLLTLEIQSQLLTVFFYLYLELDKGFSNFKEMDCIYG